MPERKDPNTIAQISTLIDQDEPEQLLHLMQSIAVMKSGQPIATQHASAGILIAERWRIVADALSVAQQRVVAANEPKSSTSSDPTAEAFFAEVDAEMKRQAIATTGIASGNSPVDTEHE